ncbi:MAG: helix-turn-helix domain-containing protein [Peptococcaceae bacterium]|jgi:transcriptional regulator with XRE-family HTH domain|nr:helix-turn-helix domain-containing protein [Peptococcaceae bacterium]
MGGRPIKPLPDMPENHMSVQQAALYQLVKGGRTVREAAADLGIPAKQASRQLAVIRKKAGSLPPTAATPGQQDIPVSNDWHKEALALVEDGGLSPGEAARRLGIAPGTVRSLLCRRRKSSGRVPRPKMACYRWEEEGYLPPAGHPGTGFGLRLSHVRRRAGVAREQLAALGGITVALLERLEKGEYLPDWRLGQKLCRVLGVDLADLVVPCGRVELARELLLGTSGDLPKRRRPVRRLAAAGGEPVAVEGPGGRVVMHGKGGRFILHLTRAGRVRARQVLGDRRLRLLELTGDGGALYLAAAADVQAVGVELGRTEE